MVPKVGLAMSSLVIAYGSPHGTRGPRPIIPVPPTAPGASTHSNSSKPKKMAQAASKG